MNPSPLPSVRSSRARKQASELKRLAAEATDETFDIEWRTYRGRPQIRWTVNDLALVNLLSLPYLRNQLDGVEAESVAHARADGASWDSIGYALGITRAAARKRHPDADRQALALLNGGEV